MKVIDGEEKKTFCVSIDFLLRTQEENKLLTCNSLDPLREYC